MKEQKYTCEMCGMNYTESTCPYCHDGDNEATLGIDQYDY